MDLANRIDELLKERGLSRRQAAIRAGIPPSSFQSAMQRNGNMTVDMIEKISSVLNCKISDILSPTQEAEIVFAEIETSMSKDDAACVDEFISMLKSPVIQKLGMRWMEFSEKQRAIVCEEMGRRFVKCEEPFYSREINGHLATLLIDHGFFPSSYDSLIKAGFSFGDAYALMDYAKEHERGNRRIWTEDRYKRLEDISQFLDKKENEVFRKVLDDLSERLKCMERED